jgi:predicted transcriptional regulator
MDADRFLEALKGVCERVTRGDYADLDDLFALTEQTGAPQVVRELAEAFASMAVQVEGREFHLSQLLQELGETNRQLDDAQRRLSSENVTLRDQMQRMQVEIDQGRKDREVSEIIETDYFQTLQSRAREMRSRHRP